ncbi:MAG: ABC transporter ATP-binding protein [Planctomycetes bacterium]|nr:ABC transporter ATP-binding protein [Planctomycetota bacterium]
MDLSELQEPPQTTPRPIIEVKDLRKSYAGIAALDGISFHVHEGEIFGFIGPNGAGKTTTLKILSTLLEPSGGEAWIAGWNVVEEPQPVRRVIGYMPDEFGVYEGLTVWEYLDFFAGAFRIERPKRRSILEGVLELTDLEGLSRRMVSTLSKGMRQRLCLAKTLIHDPKVLILDEPASAMDPRARIELRELLKELRAMGKTILISSHILTELSDICTSVGIIERGRMVECGRIEAIASRAQPAHRIRMAFHAECPRAADLLSSHPEVRRLSSNGKEVEFEYTGRPERFYEIVKLLVDRQVPILTISHDVPNLEHLFLEVTRGEVQ